MAVSPLADFDWDNLTGENFVTVLKVLCSALQERYNVGRMGFTGSIDGNPGLNPHPTVLKDYFPYGDNDPKWMGDSWPLALVNQDINDLLDAAAGEYFDKDELDAQIGDSAPQTPAQTQLFVLGFVAQDPAYPNRLFELVGYTDYPDIKTGSAAELKKLYDLITYLKWVWRPHGISWDDFAAGDNDTEYTGEFDVEQGYFYVADGKNGANFYQGGGNQFVVDTNTTPFTDFKTGNSNLFTGGAASYLQTDHDSVTYPISRNQRHYCKFRTASDSPSPGLRGYINWIHAFKIKEIYDWSVARAVVGFTGKPDQVEKYNYISTSSGVNIIHTGFSYTAEPEGKLRKCTATFTDIDADSHTVEYDDNLPALTIPASIPSENGNSAVIIDVFDQWEIEHWDHEDGFMYYTPP